MARSRITGEQIVDEDVLSEEEHDAWVHTNLVCSGTVNIQDAPVMISGSGDIYCNEIHPTVPITAEAETTGYTGTVSVITDITPIGTATKKYFIYEDGLLTTVSGNETINVAPQGLLSIE